MRAVRGEVVRYCVFCGSHEGADPAYAEAARTLAHAMAGRGIGLVFGGGRVGLMGIVADAVMAAGGEAFGVIPHALQEREVGHDGLTEMHVVASMHERKALMESLSDGFIALPGGFGTFEELLEITTWSQLGVHAKPVGVLNVAGYYDPLLVMLERGVEQGFIRPVHRDALQVGATPAVLLDRMAGYVAPVVERWVSPDAT